MDRLKIQLVLAVFQKFAWNASGVRFTGFDVFNADYLFSIHNVLLYYGWDPYSSSYRDTLISRIYIFIKFRAQCSKICAFTIKIVIQRFTYLSILRCCHLKRIRLLILFTRIAFNREQSLHALFKLIFNWVTLSRQSTNVSFHLV